MPVLARKTGALRNGAPFKDWLLPPGLERVQLLKIDASFVRAIGKGSGEAVIPRTIIGLAHGLSMRVVAEGVEQQDQAEYLARLLTLADALIFLSKGRIRLDGPQYLRESL